MLVCEEKILVCQMLFIDPVHETYVYVIVKQ